MSAAAPSPRRFCVAPMLDLTDRHCRYFLRLISRHAWLYSEMVTTGAILRGDHQRFLRFDPAEHPLALQLGGSDPRELAACARIGEEYGYDEINLNVGCPSDRVRSGRFGACLMAEPALVAECVASMRAAVSIPVTVKSRIGIDGQDSYEDLYRFITTVAQTGCTVFIAHARKAWLQGLSPKENREIPPLRYDVVYRLKQELPHLEIIINGGITTLEQAAAHLHQVDGVMVGREAYYNPYLLAPVDALFYDDSRAVPKRHEIIERLLPYIEHERARGTPLHSITRHILGLFHGVPGARAWRRHLSEQAPHKQAGTEVVKEAARHVRKEMIWSAE